MVYLMVRVKLASPLNDSKFHPCLHQISPLNGDLMIHHNQQDMTHSPNKGLFYTAHDHPLERSSTTHLTLQVHEDDRATGGQLPFWTAVGPLRYTDEVEVA